MFGMNQMDILTTILTLAIIAIGFFAWVEIERRRNIQHTHGKVLVQIWTQSAKIHKYLVPFDGAILKCNYEKGAIPKELRDVDEKGDDLVVYTANAGSMAQILYPHEKGFGVNYSCNVPTVAFMEGDPDPITERSKRVGRFATSLMIGERLDEQFGIVAGAFAADNARLREDVNKAYAGRINPIYVYVALGVAVVLMAISLYFNYQFGDDISDIKAGIGI